MKIIVKENNYYALTKEAAEVLLNILIGIDILIVLGFMLGKIKFNF